MKLSDKVYNLNAYISMNYIALKKQVSYEDITLINFTLGDVIKKLREIEEIEVEFDMINSDYGSKDKYCIYCNSNEYDSKVGIVHNEKCPLLKLRELINDIQQ